MALPEGAPGEHATVDRERQSVTGPAANGRNLKGKIVVKNR